MICFPDSPHHCGDRGRAALIDADEKQAVWHCAACNTFFSETLAKGLERSHRDREGRRGTLRKSITGERRAEG